MSSLSAHPDVDRELSFAGSTRAGILISTAADTPYGLSNYLQSTDTDRIQRVARKLRSGMVEINGNSRSAGSPFGGFKQSGNGREGGIWGLEDFLEVKAIGGWQA